MTQPHELRIQTDHAGRIRVTRWNGQRFTPATEAEVLALSDAIQTGRWTEPDPPPLTLGSTFGARGAPGGARVVLDADGPTPLEASEVRALIEWLEAWARAHHRRQAMGAHRAEPRITGGEAGPG